MHSAWIRHCWPRVCCPSAQSTQKMLRFHLGMRNAMTSLPQSRFSHLCLSCCHLSSSVPECCQRPSAVSPSPGAWKNNKLPWKLCVCLYSKCPSQDKMKHLRGPDGVRIISQFFPKKQWKERKLKVFLQNKPMPRKDELCVPADKHEGILRWKNSIAIWGHKTNKGGGNRNPAVVNPPEQAQEWARGTLTETREIKRHVAKRWVG